MFLHPEGYAFEGYIDTNNKIGIKEGFDGTQDGYNIVLGVMQNGEIAPSYFIDNDIGFQPFTLKVTDEDSLNTFLRSHKGTYMILGEGIGVCIIKVGYLSESEVTINSVDLFVPKGEIRCDGKPYVVCEKLDIHQGLHTRIIEEEVLQGYVDKIQKIVGAFSLDSRESLMYARMKNWKGMDNNEG